MKARIECGGALLAVDLSRPISIAMEQDFGSGQPRFFGAPPATQHPFSIGDFSGSVAQGASCNCNSVTLIPHCNGTHTECVGHLTVEPLDAHRVVPASVLTALLVSVAPVAAEHTDESTEPTPRCGDSLITRSAVEQGWPASLPFAPQALILRTLPDEHTRTRRGESKQTPPYLTREAVQFMVERGIEHLIVDLPSVDRSQDEGRLSAHRLFFGLPRGSRSLPDARRARATITELAFIPDELADAAYLLQIQVPAIGGDAVPSRPLLYRLDIQ